MSRMIFLHYLCLTKFAIAQAVILLVLCAYIFGLQLARAFRVVSNISSCKGCGSRRNEEASTHQCLSYFSGKIIRAIIRATCFARNVFLATDFAQKMHFHCFVYHQL